MATEPRNDTEHETGTEHESGIDELVQTLTIDEKVALLTGEDTWSLTPIERIGLQSIVMSDGPAGVRGRRWDERDPSCNLPSPTAVSASWDAATVRDVGRALGSEARRKNVHVLLAPTINLHRAPYGGRHFEAFSEDPVLTADVAAHYVEGVQSMGVAATLKHYVANDSETDRFTVDVRVDDRTLRELYLAAFERPVVESGAWAVMSAYNSINGATATENPLLTEPLTGEWGFDGVVVSDWTAVRSLESARHPQHIAMPGPAGPWGPALVEAVRSGEIAESIIDEKVRRILRLARRVGALGSVAPDADAPLDAAETVEVSRRAAREGMVLLRNADALPLSSAPARVALIGEGARHARTQGGGSATVVPASTVSPLEGLAARWPDAEVTWSHGAVVQQGLAPLDMSRVTTPEGEPGLLVRFLDAHGVETGREIRHASFLAWFDGASAATRAASVEVSLRYRSDAPGALRLGLGGLADVELKVEGEHVASAELRTVAGDDPATAVLNPPFTTATAEHAPADALVVARFRPVAGVIPDALALRIGTPPVLDAEDALIAEAVESARASDVAIVVVGTSNEVESEGFDRADLRLPGRQDDLVRAVAAVSPRTIVIVNAGAPVLLPWRDEVDAVIAAWFPGQEFGHALADVVSGDHEPGGRLPVTWPDEESAVPVRDVTPTDGALEYSEGLHIGYRAWSRAGRTPAYPFGHGLGFTRWAITGIEVERTADGGAIARTVVRNTGDRPGKFVAQFFAQRPASAIDRPDRWLVSSETGRLDAGASATVETSIPRRRFEHWTASGWALEPGVFVLSVGASVIDVAATAELEQH